MWLNAAGTLFVQHARRQVAELDRVRAGIADLSGLQHGRVALVCSQAFIDTVMPAEVGAFRTRHPGVTFSVQVRDHAQAAAALIAYDADLALVLQPVPLPELQVLCRHEQPVCVVMDARHPLAGTGPVRLRDCLRFPAALPDRTLAVRQVLDAAVTRGELAMTMVVESGSVEFLRNYVRREHVVSFQVSMGIPCGRADLIVREIDRRDIAPLQVVLIQLRERKLSVAATEFASEIAHSFGRGFGAPNAGQA